MRWKHLGRPAPCCTRSPLAHLPTPSACFPDPKPPRPSALPALVSAVGFCWECRPSSCLAGSLPPFRLVLERRLPPRQPTSVAPQGTLHPSVHHPSVHRALLLAQTVSAVTLTMCSCVHSLLHCLCPPEHKLCRRAKSAHCCPWHPVRARSRGRLSKYL